MTLRPYQQEAHNAVMDWVVQSVDPCLIDAATGSGKSHVIAALAETIYNKTGKRVLCLAPSKELVEQNREKYLATGNPASMFSASAGQKCLRHPVVFGTPGTVKNRVSRFGAEFAMIVVDEAHGITPTIKAIIERVREKNQNLRVVGLTATPYRLGTGYIFAMDNKGKPVNEAHNPYFTACVFKVHARELIAQGYLTPPLIGPIGAGSYATKHMQTNSMGKFAKADVDRAYHGHGRKTAAIIADVVAQSQSRNGVMIFAATVQHAEECMASLPPELSAIVTAKTPTQERARILNAFKAKRIKYIVNVAVLTTGFDASHVDVIAMLRATESVGLLQQIVGRGLRIEACKDNCLILDYAENLDRHCPDGDIFAPEIKVTVSNKEKVPVKCVCPLCHSEQEFSGRPNDDGFDYSDDGYFLDLDGNVIEGDYGPIPSHFGRRCMALHLDRATGKHERCSYRWNGKECPHCMADNDIAARYCCECKGEIVNPNEKLRIDFKRMKRDPTQRQTDEVLSLDVREGVSQMGNPTIRADWVTEYRSFSTWFQKDPKSQRGLVERDRFLAATKNGQPSTITYEKDAASGFYRLHGYNKPKDEAPV